MSFVQSIKTAPRWTWYTVGGVSAGVIGIKLWKGRNAPAKTPVAGDGATTGDAGSPDSYQPATTGSSPPGVIVPPIITGGSDGGSLSELGGILGGLMGGTIDDLTGLLGTVITGDQTNMSILIGGQQQQNEAVIGALGGAGGAPGTVATNPTPVIVQMPAPARPPAPSPPVATGSSPQPTSTTKSCPDLFGYIFPHHNPANGAPSKKSCFYNHCVNHKEDHVYADGHTVHDTDSCPTNGQRY